MSTRLLALVGMATAVSACGPSVQYHRDASVTIPAGATWEWGAADADSPAPRDARIQPADSIVQMIADAIEVDLTGRGFPRVAAGEAAFVVHFHAGRRTMVDTLRPREDASPAPGVWVGGYGRPEVVGDRVVAWQEGMLVVDVLPRDRRTVVWRGIIADEIPEAAERNPRPAIREAVARLMRGFP